MGAGAGYTIDASGFDVTGDIKSFTLHEKEKSKYWSWFEYQVDCEVDYVGTVEEFEAKSYMYKTDCKNTKMPIKCNNISVIFDEWAVKDVLRDEDGDVVKDNIVVDRLNDIILDNLLHANSSFCYGGGWCHCTFDGQLTENGSISGGEYCHPAIEIIGSDMKLTNESDIKYIDDAVSGEKDYTTWEIYKDGEPTDNVFDDEQEADKFVEENESEKGNLEVVENWWHETYDGDIEWVGP